MDDVYQKQLHKLLSLSGSHGKTLKQIGKNPKSLSKIIYINEILPQIDKYIITDKADGQRAIIEIDDKIKILSDTYVEYNNDSNIPKCVLECEIISENNLILVYDILSWDNNSLINEIFEKRLNYFESINWKINRWTIVAKTFIKLTISTYQNDIMKLYNVIKNNVKKYKYETDGMIFTNKTTTYNNAKHFKWKPPEKLTIDFLSLSKDGKNHELYCGIDRRMFKKYGLYFDADYKEMTEKYNKFQGNLLISEYFPIKFRPSIAPNIANITLPKNYDGKILEMRWNKGKWEIYRVRDDRNIDLKSGIYYGNNFRIAELTYHDILHPFTIKDLIEPYNKLVKSIYFSKRDYKYKLVRKFNNRVKRFIISRYNNSTYVIDMASGRGQDLQKYIDARIKHLLMLEIDKVAIDELVNMKHDILGKLWVDKIDVPPNVTTYQPQFTLDIAKVDLNQIYTKNIKELDKFENFQKNKVDVIFCNLAFHYMINTFKNMTNIIKFISYWLKPSGFFIFTAFDGNKVNKLLGKKNEWVIKDNNDILYSIKKRSKNIEVLLPCSDTPKEEPLISLSKLDVEFNKVGILRVETESFEKYLQNIEQNNNEQFNELIANLSENDKTFISLYSYVIWQKIN